MPVPGPRNQYAPLPGYRNPEGRSPDFFNQWDFPHPVRVIGRSPGTMFATLRGCVLAPGQVRTLWRQAINYVNAARPYSWTDDGPQPGYNQTAPSPVGITRALRYMTRSVYMGQGIDNSRFEGLHTAISPRGRRTDASVGRRVTIAGGSVRSRPTIRNRLTSLGSRVEAINQAVDAAE